MKAEEEENSMKLADSFNEDKSMLSKKEKRWIRINMEGLTFHEAPPRITKDENDIFSLSNNSDMIAKISVNSRFKLTTYLRLSIFIKLLLFIDILD